MTQNVFDNTEFFFEGYSQLGRSVEGLAGAAEWPTLRAVVPDLRGLKVLDLGCGFGWFCRWAREQGATQVLGLDVSKKMLARAKAATSDAGIKYAIADMELLDLPEASIELVYSSLALHYIEDLAKLMAKVHHALVPGGHLVFSIEHPIYMAPRHPGCSRRSVWRLSLEAALSWFGLRSSGGLDFSRAGSYKTLKGKPGRGTFYSASHSGSSVKRK